MNAKKNKYTDRPTHEIDAESYIGDIEILHPELLVLSFSKRKNSPIKIRRDVGKFCYTDREEGDNSRDPTRNYVRISSLDKNRRDFVKNFLAMHNNPNSIVEASSNIKYFFDFIDGFYEKKVNFKNLESVRQAYVSFSQHLTQRMDLSGINSDENAMSSAHAYNQQKAAVLIAMACFPRATKDYIQSWAPIIDQREHVRQATVNQSDDAMARAFAIHATIFKSLAEFIVQKKDFPVQVKFSALLGYPKFTWYTSENNTANNFRFTNDPRHAWIKYAYNDEDQLTKETWIQLANRVNSSGGDLGIAKTANPQSHLLVKRQSDLRSHNRDKGTSSALRRTIANIAIYHFCHILMGDTGCNLEQLVSIDFRSEKPISGIEKTRVISTKPRAGSYSQPIEFRNKFEPFWRLYIELRKWCTRDHRKRIGIFNFGKANEINPFDPSQLLTRGKSIFFPQNAPYLKPTDWRKHVSYLYLEASGGDVAWVSNQILFNSPTTALKHYASRRLEDSAKEIVPFLKKLRDWAHIYKNKTKSKVSMVGEDTNKTTVGRCIATSADDATRSKQFNDNAPSPRCGAPLTCFFCEKFGLHADIEDVIRLLTVSKWLGYHAKYVSKNIDEYFTKYGPIISRINEIIESLWKISPKLITSAMNEFEQGRMDPFWAEKIDEILSQELF